MLVKIIESFLITERIIYLKAVDQSCQIPIANVNPMSLECIGNFFNSHLKINIFNILYSY